MMMMMMHHLEGQSALKFFNDHSTTIQDLLMIDNYYARHIQVYTLVTMMTKLAERPVVQHSFEPDLHHRFSHIFGP